MTRLGYIVFGIIFLAFIIIISVGTYVIRASNAEYFAVVDSAEGQQMEETVSDTVETITVQSGDTFVLALTRGGVSTSTAQDMVNQTQEVYDLASILAGNDIRIIYDGHRNELKEVVYEINSNEEFVITTSTASGWNAERKMIEYDIEIVRAEGVITTSLYEAAKDVGIDDAIIIELATVFQWTIDFALDTRVDDHFNFIFQKRYRNGEYVDTGRVLAAEYIQGEKIFEAFFFEESEDIRGYFDAEGNSLRREFLKAPVAYKYITSGYTTGRRYIRAFNVSTGHRAIDYAAAQGTPIRAVGNGTVVFAGWNGSYGRFTSIHHNDTYTTNYAHQSRITVSYGDRVSQGDIIGYVGSTGLSTGPHLHYEMVKRGIKINPLREEFPPGEAVKEESMEKFQRVVEHFRTQLKES